MTKLSVDDGENGKKEGPRYATQLNYDAILMHIGQVGKYSLRIFIPLCVAAIFSPVVMIYNFVGGMPKYRCRVDGCDNETSPVYDEPWLNFTTPMVGDGWDRCHRYDFNWTDVAQCSVDPGIRENVTCNEWVYDTSVFESTVVSEFTLTCDDQWMQTLANSLYMAGWLIGAVTSGNLADFFGRRIMFSLLSLYFGGVVLGTAFAADYVTFAVLRAMAGFGESGFYLALYVWGLEAIGPKYRITFSFIFAIGRALGIVLLGVLGYFVRVWWQLQIIWASPILLLSVYYWFIPESTRWLISKERYEEAQKQILKAAEVNGKVIPSHLLLPPRDFTDNNNPVASTDALSAPGKEPSSRRSSSTSSRSASAVAGGSANETLIDVFKTPVLLKRILVMIFTWIATIMGYYGITFAASNLAGDFYLNFELSAVVELPAHFMGIFTMNYFGRRATTSGCLIAGGIASLITGFVPAEPEGLRIGFSLFGKFCISCAVACVYSYTLEMFPTATRSAAVGLCSTSGRIGGILAPTISALGETNTALPYIIFGGVDLIMGCMVLTLPETKGTALPSNIQEAKDFEKYNLACFRCGGKKSDEDGG